MADYDDIYADGIQILPQFEEFLTNFKVQLKNQVRFTSLKIICARKVADFWPTYAIHGLTKLSSVLPKTLCSLVYQEFMESNKNVPWWRADCREFNADLEETLLLFAGDGLEEFDCKILKFHSMTYTYQQFFEKLAERSVLRSFKDSLTSGSCSLLLSEYYSLQTMSNLVVLELGINPLKEADLEFIGHCLPLLKRLLLNFRCQNFSVKALGNLRNLKFLKHFTFEVDDSELQQSVQLVKNCLLLIPQVNTVATSDLYSYFVPHEFPSYQAPVELELEHLVLGKNSVIPSNVTLPNVTKITILDYSLNIPPLLQFKKLQDLSLCWPFDWSQVEKVLSEVGHHLKKLKLSWYTFCSLLQVLHFCPNLYELHFVSVEFLDHFHFLSTQSRKCFLNLKRFIHEIDDTDRDNLIDSNGLLHLLLTSCPELEELKFVGIDLTKEEIDLINECMEAGALSIQKLEKIYVQANVDEEVDICFAEFARKLCVENYRNFKEVYIHESWVSSRRVPEMQLTDKMQYYFNNKHQFVKNPDF